MSRRIADVFQNVRRMDGLKKIGNLADAVATGVRRSNDLVDESTNVSRLFSQSIDDTVADGLVQMKRRRLEQLVGKDNVIELDNYGASARADVTQKNERLQELYNLKQSDPDAVSDGDLRDAIKDLDNAQKELKALTDYSKEIHSMEELNSFKQVRKNIDDAKRAANDKSASFCTANPNHCLGAGIGATVTAYYTLESWQNLKEKKRQCLAICYPDDYKTNRANPTYKTADHPQYAPLYPQMKDQICTPENMTKKGATNCDEFCPGTCDYDFDDVVANIFPEAADDVAGVFSNIFGKVLGENWKWWLLLFLCVPLIALVALMFLKRE